jgi:hypothetical protein
VLHRDPGSGPAYGSASEDARRSSGIFWQRFFLGDLCGFLRVLLRLKAFFGPQLCTYARFRTFSQKQFRMDEGNIQKLLTAKGREGFAKDAKQIRPGELMERALLDVLSTGRGCRVRGGLIAGGQKQRTDPAGESVIAAVQPN